MKKQNTILISILFFSNLQCQSPPNNGLDPGKSPEGIKVGENITIKSQFKDLPVVEPHISAHPSDPNHLLIAAMVVTDINRPYESCRLSSFVSQDNGLHWKETAHNWWDYDPWTAILPSGQTAMSWIGTYGSFQDKYPIQFFTSDNGGITWNQQVQTLEGSYDGTKITGSGDVFYFTTVRFRENMGADIILCRRVGNGAFEEVGKIDGNGERLNFCEPAILSDGTVVVPASLPGKKTWVQIFNPGTREFSQPYLVHSNPGGGGGRGYMRMAADVASNSPYKDRLYLVRASGEGQHFRGIQVNVSSDKGKTWSSDFRVDHFADSKKGKARVPSVTVNNRGTLAISWVDSQHDPAAAKNDVYFTASKDGGRTFVSPVRISSVSSDPHTEGNADVANKFPGGGHYLGLAAKSDGSFQVVWSDSRSGIFEIQTCQVEVQ